MYENVESVKEVIAEVGSARVFFEGISPGIRDWTANVGLIFREDFVRITLQSTGAGVRVGKKIFIYDQRPSVVEAARDFFRADTTGNEKKLATAINQLAWVVVMRKEEKDGRFFNYVNLFSPRDDNPAAFFSVFRYMQKSNAGFRVEYNHSLWSFTSFSRSISGSHHEMMVAALTDDLHKVAISVYGFINLGSSVPMINVLGSDLSQIPVDRVKEIHPEDILEIKN